MAKVVRCYKPGGVQEDLTEVLSLKQAQKLIGGWVESITYGKLTIWCDEEGKIKQLPPTMRINGNLQVGTLYAGRLSSKGLVPVDEDDLRKFEDTAMTPI